MAGNTRPPNNARPSQSDTTAQNAGQYAVTQQGFTLPALLNNYQGKIAAALPKHMTPERMIRVALTTFYRTPELWVVDPLTVAGAIVQASELGLEPNGILGHAYLVPFYNKTARRKECQLLVGYKGFIDLARRSGRVLTVNAHIVHSQDFFDCELGTEEYVKHRPLLMKKGRNGEWIMVPPEERGPMVLTYAAAKLKDEGSHLEVMSIGQVEEIRQNDSGAPNSPAWTNHYGWMVRKTVLRQLCKLLPLSVEMHAAVGLEDTAIAGLSQNLEDNLRDMNGRTWSIPASDEPPPGDTPDPPPSAAAPSQPSGPPPPPPPPGIGDPGAPEPRRPAPPQPAAFGGQQQPLAGVAPPLTTDAFDGPGLTTLQGLLRFATAKLQPAEQINNRARVNTWLARFTDVGAAMSAAEEMKLAAEQASQ